jgi:hypothetical protein
MWWERGDGLTVGTSLHHERRASRRRSRAATSRSNARPLDLNDGPRRRTAGLLRRPREASMRQFSRSHPLLETSGRFGDNNSLWRLPCDLDDRPSSGRPSASSQRKVRRPPARDLPACQRQSGLRSSRRTHSMTVTLDSRSARKGPDLPSRLLLRPARGASALPLRPRPRARRRFGPVC